MGKESELPNEAGITSDEPDPAGNSGEGKGGRTFTQAQVNHLIAKAKRELQLQFEERQGGDGDGRSQKALQLQAELNKALDQIEGLTLQVENLGHEKAKLGEQVKAATQALEQERTTVQRREIEKQIAQIADAYQFAGPMVKNLTLKELAAQAKAEVGADGALVVKIAGKPAEQYVKEYAAANRDLLAPTTNGGSGAAGSAYATTGNPIEQLKSAVSTPGALRGMTQEQRRELIKKAEAAATAGKD